MRGMNALRRLLLTVGAAGAALSLLAMPVAAEAATDVPLAAEAGDEATEEPAEGESGEGESGEGEGERVPIAETPRDRIGLIFLAALILGGGAAVANGRRQLKGERPQASGEFRWR